MGQIIKSAAAATRLVRLLFVRETFKWVLIGALIILTLTTILTRTGLAASLGQDERVLFFLQIVSLLASIGAAVGLIMSEPPPRGSGRNW